MKNYLLIFALVLSLNTHAQNKTSDKFDPIAIEILDHMADIIGDLESCSFSLSTSYDYMDPDYGFIKHYSTDDVFFDGANKLLVQKKGTKGNKGFWYNGTDLNYYSYDENNYVTIPAPSSTLAMIDSVHQTYDITFPAADFFYPSLTDDILEGFDSLKYLGKSNVANTDCFLIKASSDEMDVLLWIANEAYKLPKKHVIRYKNKDNRTYEATFSNWALNPNIPNSLFEFVPPASASKIKIRPKN